jgi:serine/threonine protein kinase
MSRFLETDVILNRSLELGVCFLMEDVCGVNLYTMNAFLSKTLWFQVAVQIVNAVDCLHSKGYLHTDISPANICVNSENIVKIIDLGLAVECNSERISVEKLKFRGTNGFIAPEVEAAKASNEEITITSATDTFSVGKVLFHLLVNKGYGVTEFRTQIMKLISSMTTRDPKIRIKLKHAAKVLNKISK